MRSIYRKLLTAAAIGLLVAGTTRDAWATCCSPEGPEEFVGPLGGWINFQTACGAVGNGTTDDTSALNTCIGMLSSTTPVLYIPAPSACYKITASNTAAIPQFAQIIGADPSTTQFCAGSTNTVTLNANNTSAATSASHASPFTNSNLTIGAGSNICLIVIAGFHGAATSPTATWNGTPMTLWTAPTYSPSVAGSTINYMFALSAPTTGNHAVSVSWTGGAMPVTIEAVAFNNCNQAAPIGNYVVGQGSGSSSSVTAALSISGLVTIDLMADAASLSSPTQTNLYTDGTNTFTGASYSTAANPTFGWTTGSHTWEDQVFLIEPATIPSNILLVNGSSHATINRLTFNGNLMLSNAVNQSWDGSTGNFDTEVRYQDDVFENAYVGFNCGQGVGLQGCSETELVRDTFNTNGGWGLETCNANALDEFAWYSTFINNVDGLDNSCGHGEFHAYESYFQNNQVDFNLTGGTGGYSAYWDYSIGSGYFMYSNVSGNPCPIRMQGNTVLDTTQAISVQLGCLGPLSAFDNTFRSASSVTGISGQIIYTSICTQPTDYLGVGNVFATPLTNPVNICNGNGGNYSFDETIVPRASLSASVTTAPTLPSTPPLTSRTITEETSSSSTIQADINSACSGGTTRPVIHLQAGTYTGVGLTLPANCDGQLIGDGNSTALIGNGSTPVLSGTGPQFWTIRDLQLCGTTCGTTWSGTGMSFSGVDQAAARVFMDGVAINGSGSSTNLSVNGLANATVEAHNFFPGAGQNVITGPSGVWGGAQEFEGFAGASSVNAIGTPTWVLSGNAHAVIRDMWYDNGGGGNVFATVTGSGAVTWHGGTFAVVGNGQPSIQFNNYSGVSAIVGGALSGSGISFSNGAAPGQNTVAAIQFSLPLSVPAIFNNSPKTPLIAIANQNSVDVGSTGEIFLAPTNGFTSPANLSAAFAQLRGTQPTVPGSPLLPSGASDLRIYRVFVNNSATGISINP